MELNVLVEEFLYWNFRKKKNEVKDKCIYICIEYYIKWLMMIWICIFFIKNRRIGVNWFYIEERIEYLLIKLFIL